MCGFGPTLDGLNGTSCTSTGNTFSGPDVVNYAVTCEYNCKIACANKSVFSILRMVLAVAKSVHFHFIVPVTVFPLIAVDMK